MSAPPEPPPGINFMAAEPQGVTYGPNMFYSQVEEDEPTPQLNEPLPKAWSEGGVIESVKRAVVASVRTALRGTSLGRTRGEDELFDVDIEYPTDITKYPTVWVQFSIESLKRAGLAMQSPTQDNDGNWGMIQERIFTGRITLTIAALSSKDRDRLADTVISALSFSRPPDLVIRKNSDTQQDRGLITALNNNPYVAMTLSTDEILSGGQTVTAGTPWAPNILLYEDNYAIECQGQFNIRFGNDGVYTLAAINVIPVMDQTGVPYNDEQWLGWTLVSAGTEAPSFPVPPPGGGGAGVQFGAGPPSETAPTSTYYMDTTTGNLYIYNA